MTSRVLLCLSVCVAAAHPTASASAQRLDSTRAKLDAQRAQAQFERERRSVLPETPSRPSTGYDEHIGRLSYWYDDDPLPEEPPRVRLARDRLLASLASASWVTSGDPWIAGQRVRYLAEGERGADAVAAARECRSTGWWCDALLGFALHTNSEEAAADSAFTRALAAMPADERCRWTNITVLLDGDIHDRYEKMPCSPARDSIEARFWWLSQPLYTRETNDRRTEHFARVMMTQLQQDAATTIGMKWGDDLGESWIRYGWPRRFSQTRPRVSSIAAEATVTEHEPTPAFSFAPSDRAFADFTASRESDYSTKADHPRSRYAPAYALSFASLPHQTGVFRRGDSALVIVAINAAYDPRFLGSDITPALAITHRADSLPEITRAAPREGGAAVAIARTAWSPFVASVEVISLQAKHAARARFGVRLPAADTGITISDLVFVRDSLPDSPSMEDVAAALLTDTRTRRDHKLGLYWEVYGLGRDTAEASVSVTVTPVGRGWFRSATDALRITKPTVPVTFTFGQRQDGDQQRGVGALSLDLHELEPGRYRVDVFIKRRELETARVSREVELEP
ncbi:MAG: hypothetical protein M3081_00515 [Gemmatimonadota bacterium]|nr:hypothetical protein [Gemmatimonadota bacterium]